MLSCSSAFPSAAPLDLWCVELAAKTTDRFVCKTRYVYVANFLGLPSVSIPVGVDPTNDNMPVGLMMTGAWWQEDLLFRIAQACESSSSQNVPHPADFAVP